MAGLSWRSLGTRGSSELLTRALSGDDEQNAMLAGMSLVKAGQRTVKLIEEKLESGDLTPELVRLLPDVDSRKARSLLDRIAGAGQGENAEAARRCLDQIARMDQVKDRRPD